MTIKLFRFLNLSLQQEKHPDPPKCTNCGYIQERPHSLYCMRCRAEIPGASGCSGCGRCQSSS